MSQRYNKKLSDIQVYFAQPLEDWYEKHHRELPWRETNDPYLIWISEIILQQTRVNQGLGYYNRFIERFPNVATLASANEEEVLKYWQGLGYYSRARNLHKASQMIMADFNGVFPSTYEDVRKLKGVGEYTAAAILSFSANLPYAVLDGNVFRVLSRYFGIATPIDTTAGKKEFKQLADSVLDSDAPGLYNQAIMELGALQCVPISPNCEVCPVLSGCAAYSAGTVSVLPVKQGKTKVRARYFNYLHLVDGDTTFLYRREGKDIWQGLFEFPLIETEKDLSVDEFLNSDDYKSFVHNLHVKTVSVEIESRKHILSHQRIYARFFKIELFDSLQVSNEYIHINNDQLQEFAISRLTEIYLESLLA